MNIRNAVAADIPKMRALDAQASTAAHWSDANYQNLFAASEFGRRLVLVGEVDHELMASLVATITNDESELENVVVSPASQRTGIASRLLAELFRQAKELRVRTIHLEVRENNIPARRLYEKCGFQQQGKRPRYYSDPEEDALLYSISL